MATPAAARASAVVLPRRLPLRPQHGVIECRRLGRSRRAVVLVCLLCAVLALAIVLLLQHQPGGLAL